MKAIAMFLLLSVAGCAQWTQVQLDLVTQARRGVANVQKRAVERGAGVSELAELHRQRLDQAFDQDVRERTALDADWVIEHRKAYAAALMAYVKQQTAQEAAILAEKRDLEATDAALARLAWLESIQMRFTLEEVRNGLGNAKH